MKAIILCAGKSTRTHPLTVDRPKPLLRAANTEILVSQLRELEGVIDEAVLVVGFGKEMVRERLGEKQGKIKITYVEQKDLNGTGGALLSAKGLVSGKFLVLMGDNFYQRKDIEKCLKRGLCILVTPVKRPEDFGIIESVNGLVRRIEEKPKKPKGNTANAGLYVLDDSVFNEIEKLKTSKRGEIELTDLIEKISRKREISLEVTEDCFLVTYPWDLLELNRFLLDRLSEERKGKIENGAVLKGKVSVGKGSVIRSGVYIEGPVMIGENCDIGPNCFIRQGTTIGNNCRIGNAVEIKNSIIMDNTHIGHLSYVGDSVIDEKVNFGAGTITANLRHDDQSVLSEIKGVVVDTGRRKLGTIIGKNVHTGINTSIMEGRKLWPGTTTAPGEVVKRDKK